jgi:uncharacterized cupredoxin-like copper-binding protein
MKNRIALLVALAGAVAVTLGAVGAAVASRAVSSPQQATVLPQKITVFMYDFRFKLSVARAKPGKTTFTVINRGHSIHDFDLVKVHKTPFLAPGKRNTFTVTLKKGTWNYVCTVPRHSELGMHGKLVVKLT